MSDEAVKAKRRRRIRKRGFKLVQFEPYLLDTMLQTMAEAAGRIQAGETLAIALIEVGREGVVGSTIVGEIDFRHSLVAGSHYLLSDLTGVSEEEEEELGG